MKFLFLYIFTLGALLAFITIKLFLYDPAVWPDEAVFADVAYNLIQEHRLGTDLWTGLIPNIEQCACWYPPLFFITLAGWFKIADFSIVSMRILSVIIGMGFILLFYLYSRTFIKIELKSKWTYWIVMTSFVMDYVLLRATRVGRPEIYVMFLGLVALMIFTKAQSTNSKVISKWLLILCGLVLGLMVQFHSLAVFLVLAIFFNCAVLIKQNTLKIGSFLILISSFFIPPIIWLGLNFSKLGTIYNQMFLTLGRKGLEEAAIITQFKEPFSPLNILYVFYLLISVVFIVFVVKNLKQIVLEKPNYLLLSFILIFAWAFALYGKLFWYVVYPLPFVYLSFLVLIVEGLRSQRYSKGVFGFFFIMIFINVASFYLNFGAIFEKRLTGNKYSYSLYEQSLRSVIPKNSAVFMSALPDPYFALKGKTSNKLFEFPPVAISKENYIKLLKGSDYIIYTNSYDGLFGNFLLSYIQLNKLTVYQNFADENQYKVLIVKLKPPQIRSLPE